MSFGYGVGDFLAVGKLALKVYNVYKDAPTEFKDISDEIDSLQIILSQQDRAFQDRKLCTKQKEELGRILQGCKNVLKDLDELMTKYQSLGAPQSSRAIDRLRWDPEDVVKLRGRLTSNITLLNTFIANCQHEESQRSMAAIQDLLRNAAIPRRSSIASIRSFASFATTGSAKAIWKDFCRDLHGAGITANVLQTRKDEILHALADNSSSSVATASHINSAVQATDTALGSDPATRGARQPKTTTLNVGPLKAIFGRLLYAAADRGDIDAVRTWLNSTGDVEYQLDGKGPLYAAARNGHFEVVNLLLENNADSDATRSTFGQTAIGAAAFYGHLEVVKLLLEKGVNIDSSASDGSTVLQAAAYNGHLEIVKLLLEKGANIEGTETTALDSAAFNGHLEVVKLLLEKGANIEATRHDNGATPIFTAALNGHLEVVKLLLENGANIEATRSDNGATSISIAAFNGYLEVVRLLLEKGANIEATRSDTGSTPLYSAAFSGHLEVVRLLLEKGANIEASTSDGSTALDSAAFNGNLEVAKLLLDKGAKIEATTNGGDIFTTLHASIGSGNPELVTLLLDKGADMNARDQDGDAALDFALLLKARNKHEPRDMRKKRSEVIKVLRARGAKAKSDPPPAST